LVVSDIDLSRCQRCCAAPTGTAYYHNTKSISELPAIRRIFSIRCMTNALQAVNPRATMEQVERCACHPNPTVLATLSMDQAK